MPTLFHYSCLFLFFSLPIYLCAHLPKLRALGKDVTCVIICFCVFTTYNKRNKEKEKDEIYFFIFYFFSFIYYLILTSPALAIVVAEAAE